MKSEENEFIVIFMIISGCPHVKHILHTPSTWRGTHYNTALDTWRYNPRLPARPINLSYQHPALVEMVDDKVVAILDCAKLLGGPEPRLLYKYRKKNIILV